MDLARGNRAKNGFMVEELNGAGMGLNSDPLLIIKLPDSRVLRIMSRSFFLAIFLLALPSIGPLRSGSSNAAGESNMDVDQATWGMLPVLFSDFLDEGLVKRGDKGLIVGSTMDDVGKILEFLSKNGVDLDISSNLDVIRNEAFDFVFEMMNFKSVKSIDRVLKVSGILITQMKNEPLVLLQQQPNYRVLYVRRFQKTIVAMRKGSSKNNFASSTGKSKLSGVPQDARKVALRGLEDALLEPPRGPRRALLKSMNGPREMKFLPDLVGDSLEAYRRRIFISDDKNGEIEEWFFKNYPTRNQHFEMYKWDVQLYGSQITSRSMVPPTGNGISGWLRNNIKEEDFVVMKAKEQVVEEMMKDKTICLVDELFLECKNQGEDEEGEEHEAKRAYWQCLALYGNLRDQGVAVHQWWN